MKQQRGAALLMVLMILAIMAALAARTTVQFQNTWHRQSYQLIQQQLTWLARDAERIAVRNLRQDLVDSPDNTNLNQYWSQEGRLENGDGFTQDYIIVDAQACYNINSLQDNQPDTLAHKVPYNTQILRQLLTAAGANIAESDRFIDTLSDYLDADDETRPAGAESSQYQTLNPSVTTANQAIFSLNELGSLADFPIETLTKIRNQLCITPESKQQININTLTRQQAPLLSAMFLGELTEEDARQIIAKRPVSGWASADQFLHQVENQFLAVKPYLGDLKLLLTVNSRYFILHSQGAFDQQKNTMSSFLFFNKTDSTVKIYQRRYRVIE